MNKFLSFLFLFLLISNCGISKKEIKEDNNNSKIIFEKSKPITEELNQNLKLKLSKLTKGEPFLRNNSNSSGNINFETNFDKISYYKFSTIEEFNFNQPEIIFTKDNGVIFFDGKGSIFKINKDLKEIWKINNYSKKEKKLKPIIYFAQTEEYLIAADSLSKIYLIDLTNGVIKWSKESFTGFNSNIKVFEDRLMVVDFDNTIRCFSINSGKEIWNFQTDNPFIKSQKKMSLIIKGELVFFTNSIGDVTALNNTNGSLFWQTPTQSSVIYYDAFSLENSDLVFANNSIYFSNNRNEFFSINARNGVINWKQNINSNLIPTITEKFVFTVSNEGYLFVLDNQKGDVIRITNLLKNIENKKKLLKPSGFILARNKIYLSLNNGRLIKVDVNTGTQESIFKLANSKISRPKVFDKSMFLVKKNAIIKTN